VPYKDPEKQREFLREWRERNRAREIERNRRWREDHPGYFTNAARRERAEKSKTAGT
jgi:hypothetical protein